MQKPILIEIKQLQNSIVRNICHDMKKQNITLVPSLIQTEMIGYLIENEGKNVYQKDLETVFKLRRSTISGILQTLEKRNMVIRTASQDDIRVKKVELTEEAKNQFQKANQYLEKLEGKITSNITEEELSIFHKVIKQMRKNIEVK